MKFWFLVAIVFFVSFSARSQNFYRQTAASTHWVDSVYKSLSKQQRIAQLMVVRLSAKTPDKWVFYDSLVEQLVKKYDIGAICLFQGNPVEQSTFINKFQALSKTPLMICIDGETGLGMRMYDSVMKFPDQLTLGAIDDASLIYKIGHAMAEQCKRAGIQVDYAPVVDINNNPDNPVIGYRSFGEDKYKVALFGTKIMKGLQDAGVMACAKHFPGHGDVSVDSHFDLPLINKSMQQLDTLELYPFKKLFEEGVGSVMIAHLSIPAIDTTAHQPTSLSEKNVTELLRKQLGFRGISFTDALEMQGVAKYYPNSSGALQSLIAGNDMLCLPGDVPGSIKAILTAIKKHRLNKDSIEARIKKILLVKYNMGLQNVQPVNLQNLTSDLNKDVPSLRAAVAEKAITLVQLQHSELMQLKNKASIAYVAIGTGKANTMSSLMQQQYNADVFYFDYKSDSSRIKSVTDSLRSKYDEVIIGIHKLSKFPANKFGISDAALQLVQQIQQAQPALTLVFGNPYALKYVSSSKDVAVCYDDDSIFQKTAFDWLSGKFTATGKLPVTVAGYKYGTGIISPDTALAFATPESVGLDEKILNNIDSIANNAIQQHAAPGCVVLVAKDGKVVFNKAYGYMTYDSIQSVNTSTVYDLASVTKISATTVSVMKLYEDGLLDIKKTIGDYLPWTKGTDKANLILENLLLHQAGLVAWIPFYKETIDTATGIPKPGFYQDHKDDIYNVQVADTMWMRHDWVDTMYTRMLQSKLGETGKYIYSDNDFIFLGKIVEAITGKPLDEYVRETFYEPMHMSTTGFHPLDNLPVNAIAPTEHEKYFRLQLLRGYVHDPGAAMFGGVAGHAGLFSDAYDLAKLYQMLLNGGTFDGKRYLKKETIDFFTAYHSNTSRRGLGFDKPEKDNAMRKEPYPTISASPATFGHTGFTGTCVWVDPAVNVVYIFLSNRVCPDGGTNMKLSEMNVRSNIQETIYKALMH